MRNFSIKYIIFSLCVIILTVVFDQLTKEWALHNLYVSKPITFFFSLTLSFNKGVSFGMFNNPQTSQVILVIVALCIVFGLLYTMNSRNIISYSLISGGAIGNIIDRIKMQAVIDFLHLHYNDYHFPIFNVADIAICTGCGILLIIEFLQSRKNQPNTKHA